MRRQRLHRKMPRWKGIIGLYVGHASPVAKSTGTKHTCGVNLLAV